MYHQVRSDVFSQMARIVFCKVLLYSSSATLQLLLLEIRTGLGITKSRVHWGLVSRCWTLTLWVQGPISEAGYPLETFYNRISPSSLRSIPWCFHRKSYSSHDLQRSLPTLTLLWWCDSQGVGKRRRGGFPSDAKTTSLPSEVSVSRFQWSTHYFHLERDIFVCFVNFVIAKRKFLLMAGMHQSSHSRLHFPKSSEIGCTGDLTHATLLNATVNS